MTALNALKWRSKRSMLEVDLFLDRFIQHGGLDELDEEEIKLYEELLLMNDWDLLALLQKQYISDDNKLTELINKITHHN